MPTPALFGIPTPLVSGPTPVFRSSWNSWLNGSPGTVSITTSPLNSSNLLLLGGNEQYHWNSARGAYSLSQAGYDWPATVNESGSPDAANYPTAMWAIGKRNSSAMGTSFSLYSRGIWTGYAILEFTSLKGELIAQQSNWASAGTTFSVTIPGSRITEPNLVLVGVCDNDSGIGPPNGVSAGWGSVFWAYNTAAGYMVNPPVGVSQTITFTSSSSNNSGHPWAGTMLVLR